MIYSMNRFGAYCDRCMQIAPAVEDRPDRLRKVLVGIGWLNLIGNGYEGDRLLCPDCVGLALTVLSLEAMEAKP